MFNLTIKCENEAFSDGALSGELARILRKLADNVEKNLGYSNGEGRLIDHNGNLVGTWVYEQYFPYKHKQFSDH